MTENSNYNANKTNITFEDFYKDSQNLYDSTSSTSSAAIQTCIAAGIQAITAPIAGIVFGFNNTQANEEKFSNEVANYVTSDECISSLSKEIGEPKENETEEEFVERASCLLRNILKKKFKI
ncbi:hypothetical protein QUB80_18930 [Chlorogloeopsis sp. ULAP01]|uniref:hypothetical protein n=1 Tax=Chlorogloeopsis sp. ULAP01 TaxID=3056483 RepID=UPI0025AA84C9|nr:hypothetical protein [Chlorogloeopsis sp. ULAP01]MDM9382771.1 hypothetical protein [Chlorogloeopsis sp. ULAP01]